MSRLARGVADLSNWLIGWLLLFVCVMNLIQVVTRYVLNDPSFWTEEAMRYLMMWVTFIGTAAASHADEHMDANLFANVNSRAVRVIQACIIHGLVGGFSALLVWQGTRYCIVTGWQTSPTLGIPNFVPSIALPLGGLALLIISIDKIVTAVSSAKTPVETPR